MSWINRRLATGKKTDFMWYIVKPSHARFLRRKKFFDVESAKTGVSFPVKLFATLIS